MMVECFLLNLARRPGGLIFRNCCSLAIKGGGSFRAAQCAKWRVREIPFKALAADGDAGALVRGIRGVRRCGRLPRKGALGPGRGYGATRRRDDQAACDPLT